MSSNHMPMRRLLPSLCLLLCTLAVNAFAQSDRTALGTVYDDANADGEHQPAEPGLGGWTIVAENLDTRETLTDETIDDGSYEIVLGDGTWFVYAIRQNDWVQTGPPTVGFTVDIPAEDPGHLGGLDFGHTSPCPETGSTILTAGVNDNFDTSNGPEYTSASDEFSAYMEQIYGPGWSTVWFDDDNSNRIIGHTFTDYLSDGCYITDAHLTMRIRAHHETQAANDNLVFVENNTSVWSMSISDLVGYTWRADSTAIITLDLANLPGSGITTILSALQDGDLDFYIQDDTGIDYVQLEVEYCCGTLSGVKFNDLNGNGIHNVGEPGLADWTIRAYNPGTEQIISATTNSQGDYVLPVLSNGTWFIYEEQQSGWTQTTPPSVGYTITLPDGLMPPSLDFGNATFCDDPSTRSILAGVVDNFAPGNREDMSPGAELLSAVTYGTPTSDFDNQDVNQAFAHTFTDVVPDGCYVTGATLTIRLRALNGSEPENDVIRFVADGVNIWRIEIEDAVGYPWTYGSTDIVTFNLADLPPDASGITNVLAALQDGDFDVWGQDDTSVDHMWLTVQYCCTGGLPDGQQSKTGAGYNTTTPAAAPNPFNDFTSMTFSLPETAPVRVAVYDIYGNAIRSFDLGERTAGTHTVRWDGRNAGGTAVGNGVYFYQIEAAGFRHTGKLILQR